MFRPGEFSNTSLYMLNFWEFQENIIADCEDQNDNE